MNRDSLQKISANVVGGIFMLLCIQGTMANAVETQLFGNIIYNNSENDSTWSASADLFAAYKVNDKTSVLVELIAENMSEETHIEAERWWLKYSYSDGLNFAFGRFHTPIGYWNKNFHHGAFLFDTVDRPFYLTFEDIGGFLPTHYVGANLSGKLYQTAGELSYQLLVANNQKVTPGSHHGHGGDGKVDVSPQADTLFDDNLQLGFSATFKPDSLPVQFGFYTSRQTMSGENIILGEQLISSLTDIFKQQLWAIDFKGNWGDIELIAEYLDARNEAVASSNASYRATAGYVQLGYSLSPDRKISFRTAALEFEQQDPYFNLFRQAAKVRSSLAYRYDFNLNTAIKLQWSYNDYKHHIMPSENEFAVQLSLFFP